MDSQWLISESLPIYNPNDDNRKHSLAKNEFKNWPSILAFFGELHSCTIYSIHCFKNLTETYTHATHTVPHFPHCQVDVTSDI